MKNGDQRDGSGAVSVFRVLRRLIRFPIIHPI